ncbi:MAG: alpha-galactosidase [Eubacteriales bacterium]
MKTRCPDIVTVYTEEGINPDAVSVNFEETKKSLKVFVNSEAIPVRFVKLRWNFQSQEIRKGKAISVLGDDWERGYGTLEWRGVFPERCMPWYCMVADNCGGDMFTECFGVAARPNSLCFWQYDTKGVILWLDIRSGGEGVSLGGRVLLACEVIFREYTGITAYKAGEAFCREMSPEPRKVNSPVYGSNNWYYAYGMFTREEVISDAKQLMKLCAGNQNKPFMVIDDGWQTFNCDGPWETKDGFGSLRGLAEDIALTGAKPGIWFRPLADTRSLTSLTSRCHRSGREEGYLDPTHPEVLEYVGEIVRRLVDDGFGLIKHDYTTRDIFGDWGCFCPRTLTKDGWRFYNNKITSAEAVNNLYSAIREGAGDAVIIGCNTLSHSSAGVFELNRTGDDTSGFNWDRTRKFGVNTLAFRGFQHKSFYECDADCVGITGEIPWELNREWLRLLSHSGTPLFVSAKPGVCDSGQLSELEEAYACASKQNYTCEPLDWLYNAYPERYLINGGEESFNWYDQNPIIVFDPSGKID